jgi:hypothetical protein
MDIKVLGREKTCRALNQKWFVEVYGSDHRVFEYYIDGRWILRTKVSHGRGGDIGHVLIKKMARQCRLSYNQFIDLVNCTLSAERYCEIIRATL